MISVFNMLGRFFWSSLSDYFGRQRTYAMYFLARDSALSFDSLLGQPQSVAPVARLARGFYAATMLIFTLYGGGFATIPAYLADLFGTKFVGGIHGRLLTAWSTAGVIGPWRHHLLREHSLQRAIPKWPLASIPLALRKNSVRCSKNSRHWSPPRFR